MRDDPPVQFGVLRKALSQSEVFRTCDKIISVLFAEIDGYTGDMFDCCDSGFAMSTANDADRVLDLDEQSDVLSILFGLLHTPPTLLERKQAGVENPNSSNIAALIPFPLLPRMLQLADKYVLSENLQHSLLAQMSAHVPAYPLEVYAFATMRGLRPLAIEASKHLLHPRISVYSPKDISILPSPEAWHKLVLLHDIRIRGLRDILLGEDIFPHGYGTCSSHKDKTVTLWERRKMDIILRVEAGKQSSGRNINETLFNFVFWSFSN
jgi:hypothetical protein